MDYLDDIFSSLSQEKLQVARRFTVGKKKESILGCRTKVVAVGLKDPNYYCSNSRKYKNSVKNPEMPHYFRHDEAVS